MPNVIHVRGALPAAASLRWIIEELFHEQTTTLVGSSIAAAQLAQLLFVKVLRAHLASEGDLPVGWLRAIRDARIVQARGSYTLLRYVSWCLRWWSRSRALRVC